VRPAMLWRDVSLFNPHSCRYREQAFQSLQQGKQALCRNGMT